MESRLCCTCKKRSNMRNGCKFHLRKNREIKGRDLQHFQLSGEGRKREPSSKWEEENSKMENACWRQEEANSNIFHWCESAFIAFVSHFTSTHTAILDVSFSNFTLSGDCCVPKLYNYKYMLKIAFKTKFWIVLIVASIGYLCAYQQVLTSQHKLHVSIHAHSSNKMAPVSLY